MSEIALADPAPGLGLQAMVDELTRMPLVRAVAVASDGRVVSGGSDRRVLLWDSATPGAPAIEQVYPVPLDALP